MKNWRHMNKLLTVLSLLLLSVLTTSLSHAGKTEFLWQINDSGAINILEADDQNAMEAYCRIFNLIMRGIKSPKGTAWLRSTRDNEVKCYGNTFHIFEN